MSLKRSLLHFLETIHPGRYRRMSEKLLKHAIGLYFFVLGISLLLFIILGVGTTVARADELSMRLNALEPLTLDFTGTVEGEHELVTRPSVLIDGNKTDTTGAKVVFGSDRVYYKKWYLFGNDQVLYEEIKNFSQLPKGLENVVVLGIALMIPGLALALGILMTVIVLIITVLSSLIVYLIFRKSKMQFRTAWMTALHAALIPVFLVIVLLPWFSIWWIGLLLYIILFSAAAALQKEHKFKTFTY